MLVEPEDSMRNLSFLVLFLSLSSHADQAYQTNHILGDWFTMDQTIFNNYGIRITAENSTIKLQYCELAKLQMAEECENPFTYEGAITYSQSNDSLLVNEGSHSPNPSYSIRVAENDPNKFVRQWGTQQITYSRIR